MYLRNWFLFIHPQGLAATQAVQEEHEHFKLHMNDIIRPLNDRWFHVVFRMHKRPGAVEVDCFDHQPGYSATSAGVPKLAEASLNKQHHLRVRWTTLAMTSHGL